MKLRERKQNSFNGSYYGYHDEMDAKNTPVYFILLIVLCVLVVFAGVGIGFFSIILGYAAGFIYSILGVLIVEFPLIHLLIVLFDKIKYGEVRKEGKVLGPIFSAIGVVLLIGVILSRFVHFAIVCGLVIVLVFFAIGIFLCAAGIRKGKREREACTVPVKALCTEYERLNPHMPMFDETDASFAQNEVTARAEVSRPVWEFEYNGQVVHAVPEHYEGKLKIAVGKQYQIFINPQNPQEIYCEQNTDATFFLTMGKIWLVITALMVLILGVTFWLIMKP